MKCFVHTNCPFQVCSLITSHWLTREDKVARRESWEQRTLRQSEQRGKLTGRRKTNYCKHRKGKTPVITVRGVDFEWVEHLFDVRRPPDIEKQMDKCINIAHGVKGDDTLRKLVRATGESLFNPGRVSWRAKRKAESVAEVEQEVGDANSSEDYWRNANIAKGH